MPPQAAAGATRWTPRCFLFGGSAHRQRKAGRIPRPSTSQATLLSGNPVGSPASSGRRPADGVTCVAAVFERVLRRCRPQQRPPRTRASLSNWTTSPWTQRPRQSPPWPRSRRTWQPAMQRARNTTRSVPEAMRRSAEAFSHPPSFFQSDVTAFWIGILTLAWSRAWVDTPRDTAARAVHRAAFTALDLSTETPVVTPDAIA